MPKIKTGNDDVLTAKKLAWSDRGKKEREEKRMGLFLTKKSVG